MTTNKKVHGPIDDETVGIFSCPVGGCNCYTEHVLFDADPDDPCYALECCKCVRIKSGSEKTTTMVYGEPDKVTYGAPKLSDDEFAAGQDRLKEPGRWIGVRLP